MVLFVMLASLALEGLLRFFVPRGLCVLDGLGALQLAAQGTLAGIEDGVVV